MTIVFVDIQVSDDGSLSYNITIEISQIDQLDLMVNLSLLVNMLFCDISGVVMILTTKQLWYFQQFGKRFNVHLTSRQDGFFQVNNKEIMITLTTVMNKIFSKS